MAGHRKRVPKPYRQVHQLAFSPLLFQAAMVARSTGVLAAVHAAKAEGLAPAEVAVRAGVTRYAARVLLEGCLALELVALEDGRYRITDAGQLWLFDRMVGVNSRFVQDVCYAGASRLDDSLRTGRPAGLAVFGPWPTIYEGLTELPPGVQDSWFAFDHFYSDSAFPLVFPRVFEPRPRRLLDVGGNTGKWALYCLRQDPDVEVTVLDHPGQLDRLRASAVAAGLDARLHTVPIDLLDHGSAFPGGFDVVWMSQLLDCFGEPDIARLLERGAAALAPGGRLRILEAFWDRQANEVGELILQGLSLYFSCMANGTSRMYHSQDFLELIASVGLQLEADEPVGTSHTLLTVNSR
ncbi:MAG TPA: class I SAM-dependent methyltransferase [Kofleriaceae bacterium]|nr:class I SAM-dependent methyltransferase [Kofleriaceae bacterium]